MSVNDWLTPETAIGARLPCGATVVKTHSTAVELGVLVSFDRDPKNDLANGDKTGRYFYRNGKHCDGSLPDLIPPPDIVIPITPVAAPQPEGDWLTPETAIGARLPCGATVVEANYNAEGYVIVSFDRLPKNDRGSHHKSGRAFKRSGQHYRKGLPDLIPPAAAIEAWEPE